MASDALLSQLAAFDTCTVANAIETFAVRSDREGFTGPAVRCLFPELGVMVGYAVTVTYQEIPDDEPRDRRPWVEALKSIAARPGPKVAVLQDLSPEPRGCFVGEMITNTLMACGCIGLVTNGVVRDLEAMRALGFHTFARGSTASHSRLKVVTWDVPVCIEGMWVRPGDILHGDRHGVITVPRSIAPQVPEAARAVLERERAFLERLRQGVDPDRLYS